MTDVVLDLETMGTAGDSAIVSIGAVSFSGAEFYRVIANPSGALNAGTIRWWMAQREEVRAVWLTEGEGEAVVLAAFGAWLDAERDRDGTLRVWGSEDFDTAILKDAYARHNFPMPWHYQESRGLRTAFDLLGVDEDQYPWEDRIEHVAIDCARQAALVLRAALAAQPEPPAAPSENTVEAARAAVRDAIARFPGAIPVSALAAAEAAIRADERAKAPPAAPSEAVVERVAKAIWQEYWKASRLKEPDYWNETSWKGIARVAVAAPAV